MLSESRFLVSKSQMCFVLTLGMVMAETIDCRAEITSFELTKKQHFLQTSDTPPMAATSYSAQGFVYFSNPGDLTTAIAIASPGVALLTTYDVPSAYQPFYSVSGSAGYGTLAGLNTAIPLNTTGTITVSGGTLGTQSASFTTPAANYFSTDIPVFSGGIYDQLQGMNPHFALTISAADFLVPDGANESAIYLEIIRRSDKEVVYWSSASNSPTNFLVAANTLRWDTAYEIALGYSSGLSSDDMGFDGARTTFSFTNETHVTFTTTVPEASSVQLLGVGMMILAAFTLHRTRPLQVS